MFTRFIDILESRTLMSSVPVPTAVLADEAAVFADVKALHDDVVAYAPVYKADVKMLIADLKALPKSSQNTLLLNKLRTDQNKCAATLRADLAHLLAVDRPAFHKLSADAMKVFMKPTDATAQARLAADISAFQAANAAPLAAFMADLNACGTTLAQDVQALVAANPTATQLAGDLQKMGTDVTAAGSKVSNDLTQAQNDLTKLLADL